MLLQLPGQLLFFLATASFLPSAAAADTATWLFPGYIPNAPLITFESQDTLVASWTSVFVAPLLQMFCETGNTSSWSIPFTSPAPVLPNGSFALPLKSVQNVDQTCHLNLNETNGPLTGTGNSSNSGDFLVAVQPDRSASTWSTSIPTATSSSSPSVTPISTATSSSSPSVTSTSTSTPTPKPNNTGLSTGAKAGTAVGVILVVALILAALILLLLRRRRARQQRPLSPALQKQQDHASELDGENMISEMDGGDGRQEGREKDGFPIAGTRMTARELEGDVGR